MRNFRLIVAGVLLGIPYHGLCAQSVSEGLPEALQVLAAQCDMSEQSGGLLTGFLTDSATNAPLVGARIRATWRTAEDDTEARTETVAEGAFVLCHLPLSQPIQMGVEIAGRAWENAIVTIPRPGRYRLDQWIPLSDPSKTGTLVGRVVDASTGRPLSGASVSIPEAGSRVSTRAGHFVFRDLASGPHELRVERLGSRTRVDTVTVHGGYPIELTVPMAEEAIPIEGLTVLVKPRSWFRDMDGFYYRMELGLGHFITRADLERRNPSTFVDALRGVPSVRFSRRRGPRQVYRIILRRRGCPPMFYVDGRKYRFSKDDDFDPNEFYPLDIEAIEVYRGPAEVPGEFSGSDSMCGVIAIWTRR